jgi:alkylhydroperoxidase family enzyme
MIAHFRTVMNTGTIPAKLKELLFVRVSQMNRCEY